MKQRGEAGERQRYVRKQVLVHALQKFSSSDCRVPKMLDHCEAPEESKQRIPVRKM